MAIPNSDKPLLGIGPMSKNLIDALIEYAAEYQIPIMLIASRRQIDAEALGSGYVEKWSTEEFAKYVKDKLAKTPAPIFLCRDHGGPWQGAGEEHLTFAEAMETAKLSFKTDIESGFDLIHIDPSIDPTQDISLSTILDRAFILLRFCEDVAKKAGRKIEYEIGTEETSGRTTLPEEFESYLKQILEFCEEQDIAKPRFIVGQTGTLIKERRQVGNFNKDSAARLIAICDKYGVGLKEHNADYQLSKDVLEDREEIGLHAKNIAPEFGVIETLTFVDHCKKNNKEEIAEEFLQISLDSGKWKKWMISEQPDGEKAIISGHYVFGTPEFKQLKAQLDEEKLDTEIKNAHKERLHWYLEGLGHH